MELIFRCKCKTMKHPNAQNCRLNLSPNFNEKLKVQFKCYLNDAHNLVNLPRFQPFWCGRIRGVFQNCFSEKRDFLSNEITNVKKTEMVNGKCKTRLRDHREV